MPVPKRRAALLLCAAALPLAAVCLALALAPRAAPVQIGQDWKPERLREELAKAGVVYEGRRLEEGYFLRRPGDAADWQEIADQFSNLPAAKPPPPGRLVVHVRSGHAEPLGSIDAGVLRLRHFFLRGHPDDLRAIADAAR